MQRLLSLFAVYAVIFDGVRSEFSWLRHWPLPGQCLQLHSTNSDFTASIYAELNRKAQNTFITHRNIDGLLAQNASAAYGLEAIQSAVALNQRACSIYILDGQNEANIRQILTPSDNGALRFPPLSVVFVLADKDPPVWELAELDYIESSGLLAFWVKVGQRKPALDTVWLIYAGLHVQSIAVRTRMGLLDWMNEQWDAVVTNKYSVGSQKSLRISFTDCAPYVVITRQGENITHLDGLEYRFIRQVAKRAGWPLDWVDHRGLGQSFQLPPQDLLADRCDLAMCSMWMTLDRGALFDMTDAIDFQCGTFLVRKRIALPASTYVYLAFSVPLWTALMISLVVVVVLYNWLASDDRGRRKPGLTRSLLDGMNVMTGHSLSRLPQGQAARTVVLSWIVLSFLLGVSYTTRYTTLLTSPVFERPINTLQDFVDQDLVWAHVRDLNEYSDMLTGSANYQTLFHRSFLELTVDERLHNIRTLPQYAIIVKILQNNYVADVSDVLAEAVRSMRLMNSCFYNHYTVFLLRRHSRHTAYLNRWIFRYRESGIWLHWSQQLLTADERIMWQFFRSNRQPRVVQAWSLRSLSGAVVVLAVGWALSVVVFVCELVWDRSLR